MQVQAGNASPDAFVPKAQLHSGIRQLLPRTSGEAVKARGTNQVHYQDEHHAKRPSIHVYVQDCSYTVLTYDRDECFIGLPALNM